MFVARVGRAHGVAGEAYLDRCALGAAELLALAQVEWRGPGGATRALVIQAARDAHERPLVRFRGIATREAVAALTLGELWADAARLPDPGPNRVWGWQLVGLRVLTPQGAELGVVRDVLRNRDQTLVVVGERGTVLPAFAPFLVATDLEAGTLTLDLPPGFEEL